MPAVTFSGLASGIDGDAIIKALSDQKRLVAVPLENKIEEGKKETEALEEFNTKLLGLNDSLKDFLTASGGAVSKTVSSTQTEAVSATASDGAPLNSTSITVSQLAQAGTLSFNDRFASTEDPIAPNLSGESAITISVGSGDKLKTISLTVDNTTTLGDLVTQATEKSDGLFTASAVNLGNAENPQFAFLLNGAKPGVEQGLLSVEPDAGLTAEGAFAEHTLEQANNAIFTVSGIGQVVRQSNQVSDLLPGLSIELKQTTAVPVTLTVGYNSDKTADKVQEMVDKLNELIKYSKENSTITRDESSQNGKNIYGTLAKTRVDDQAIQSIKSAFSSAAASEGISEVRIMADLGVTTQRDGTYAFDRDQFIEAIGKDPIAVDTVLSKVGDTLGATEGIIRSYTKFQGQIDTATTSNEDQAKSMQERLQRIEDNIARQTESLRLLFANLESTIGRLNSQGNALTSILGQLPS